MRTLYYLNISLLGQFTVNLKCLKGLIKDKNFPYYLSGSITLEVEALKRLRVGD